jgi:hypothetical protein
MNSFRTTKNARKWVIFLLLAFIGQGVFAGVHTNMKVGQSKFGGQESPGSHCHGDMDHTMAKQNNEPDPLASSTSDAECCEEGCPMTACHSASMMLTSVHLPSLGFHNPSNFFLKQAAVLEPVSSLYRPPILG